MEPRIVQSLLKTQWTNGAEIFTLYLDPGQKPTALANLWYIYLFYIMDGATGNEGLLQRYSQWKG